MTTTETIFQDLLKHSKLHGLIPTRAACKRFLRDGSRNGITATKRKPIKREWVLRAADRQHWNCRRCGLPINPDELTGDHLIPIIEGGKHARHNIRALHKSCNSAKGGRTLHEESKRIGQTILEQLKGCGGTKYNEPTS